MLAAAFVTLNLSAFQLGASIVVVLAAVALSYCLGLDEGKHRGIRLGRAMERADRQDAAERAARERVSGITRESWFPAGRGHS